MIRRCLESLLAVTILFSSTAHAQVDRWDDLMEQASKAMSSGSLAVALKAATQAVAQGQYEDADRQVSSLALLSRISQESGEFALAERSLRQAIETMDRIPGPLQREKAILHNNLGALLDLVGDLPGAERHYRVALALYLALPAGQAEDRFSLLVNLAGLLERRKSIEAASNFYLDAESLLPRLPVDAAVTLFNNLGALHQRLRNFDAARDYFARAMAAMPTNAGQPLLRASLLHNMGTLELEAGRLDAATFGLRQAETIRRTRLGDQHVDTARTLSSLTLLLERQKNPNAALGLAREASNIVRGSLAVSSGTRAAVASTQARRDWREIFANHLRLLHVAEPDGAKQASEALEILQLVKHGELARVFAGASLGGTGELGKLTRAIRQQSDVFLGKELSLAQELQSNQPNAGRERAARAALASARKTLEGMQSDLARDFPRYHELVAGKTTPLSSVQGALRAEEAVLVYFVAESETFALAITDKAARLARIPRGHADLTRAVMEIRRTVEPEHADESRFAFDQSYALYRDLVAPLGADMERKKVWFIVPDGALESLPFALLLRANVAVERRGRWPEAPWLLRDFALVTLPSLGALTLSRSSTAPASAPEALLAFANPVLGATGESAARRSATGKASNRAINDLWSASAPTEPNRADRQSASRTAAILVGAKRLANPDQVRKLAPLPETEDEARAVAASLGGGTLMMRHEATEAKLKQMDLSRYRNLLFATHGAMANDFVELGEPALVLTPPAVASEADDGLLTASEIANLKLNADWVLLSACNTAAADGMPGAEGLSGLAKAFFHAGARNLLVSHWSVVSESTARLIIGTFARLSVQPLEGKARALQHSMLRLMDGAEGFQHPMYWAPFVVVGGGD